MPTDTELLSLEDLMTRGYFPDRVIPPVTSFGLSQALSDIETYIKPVAQSLLEKKAGKLRSRCVSHSVPKRKHLRRNFSIPNPLHQTLAASDIAENWKTLRAFCASSSLSLTIPTTGSGRALASQHDLGKQPALRAARSVGARYLLKTDIARFYPSIYTHSIPWALHGKPAARADKKFHLLGNRIDLWTRETQDKQTGGIPIGPDTSFLIGEVIGTALDLALMGKVPNLRGTRSIDDYYLYFQSISEAESALAALHGIAKDFELEVNDPKTEIVQLPDVFEPAWKTDLRSQSIRPGGQSQATDLLSLFDRAYEHSRNYPSDSVLTYAAKQVLSADITEHNWAFCEALVLRAAVSEPTMLSVLGDIYDKFLAYHTSAESLTRAIESICAYHAPLQHGNEVSWALWLAKKMNLSLPAALGDLIAGVDDDFVALVALDLIDEGRLNATSSVSGETIRRRPIYMRTTGCWPMKLMNTAGSPPRRRATMLQLIRFSLSFKSTV